MTFGSVIVLNGPSSSGKSTLAAALQRRFAAEGECWFVYALDDYIARVPFDWITAGRHVGPHAEDVDGVMRPSLVHAALLVRRLGRWLGRERAAYRGSGARGGGEA